MGSLNAQERVVGLCAPLGFFALVMLQISSPNHKRMCVALSHICGNWSQQPQNANVLSLPVEVHQLFSPHSDGLPGSAT